MKQCTKCLQTKALDDFAKNRSNKSGLHSWCKQCMSDKVLEYRGGRVYKKMRITSTHKQCRLCENMKPKSEYASRDGKSRRTETYCKECRKFMGHERGIEKYGLDLDSYMKMFSEQNGVCKICDRPEMDGRRLSIDHDHSCCAGASSCGKCIRGLICFKCNSALGMVQDNVAILKSMIKYLS